MSFMHAPTAVKLAVTLCAGLGLLVGVGAASAATSSSSFFAELPGSDPAVDATSTPDLEGSELPDIETDSGVDDDSEADTDTETEESEAGGGPDATGSAAWGLCNARAHGGLPDHSTAFSALEAAAGGGDNVEEYCDSIPKHGNKHADGEDSDGEESDNTDSDDSGSDEDSDDDATESKPSKPAHDNGKGNDKDKSHKKNK